MNSIRNYFTDLNPDQIEKYAREKYYMKRENEDIYIIEFEDENSEKVER